jgi:hypothetical protein
MSGDGIYGDFQDRQLGGHQSSSSLTMDGAED